MLSITRKLQFRGENFLENIKTKVVIFRAWLYVSRVATPSWSPEVNPHYLLTVDSEGTAIDIILIFN